MFPAPYGPGNEAICSCSVQCSFCEDPKLLLRMISNLFVWSSKLLILALFECLWSWVICSTWVVILDRWRVNFHILSFGALLVLRDVTTPYLIHSCSHWVTLSFSCRVWGSWSWNSDCRWHYYWPVPRVQHRHYWRRVDRWHSWPKLWVSGCCGDAFAHTCVYKCNLAIQWALLLYLVTVMAVFKQSHHLIWLNLKVWTELTM